MKATPTQKMLIRMLKENTGSHMLDSGGAYGRDYERNKEADFMNESEAWMDINVYNRHDTGAGYVKESSIDVTVSCFHWLDEQLEYMQEIDKKFQRFMKRKTEDGLIWSENILNWIHYRLTGIYSADPDKCAGDYIDKLESKEKTFSENTYNGENIISQVVQYTTYDDPEFGWLMFIQIHGGCDVRGGYTAPHIFKCYDDYNYLSNANEAHLICDNCRAGWETYNAGYSWEDGWEGEIDKAETFQLEMFSGEIENAKFEIEDKLFEDYEQVIVDNWPDKKDRQRGKLYISESDGLLCPYCLNGKMKAWM